MGIFGWKTNHPATLLLSCVSDKRGFVYKVPRPFLFDLKPKFASTLARI
jgi:hypothetical protein